MFIEIQRGKSFGGLTRYCLGPGEIGHEDRVQFVETLNLATKNAETAWRVMAARHYLQDELKAKHGIRVGDRGKPVGHLLVSWGAEEAEAQKLDKEQMMKATKGALKAIGAENHQAIIIAHTDTEHPHCHVVINLIRDDGRLKDNTDEKRKLSRFALEHETQVHGEPVVKKRFKNWQDRDAGETPTPVKKKARHLYEIEKAVENGDIKPETANRLISEQQRIEKKREQNQSQQKANVERLRWCHLERKKKIEAATKTEIRTSNSQIRKSYGALWEQLYDDQQSKRAAFNANESSLKGSLENALRLADWFTIQKRPKDTGKSGLRQFFNLLVSESSRREELAARQNSEKMDLRSEQKQAEDIARSTARKLQAEKLKAELRSFQIKLGRMVARHNAQKERLKNEQQILAKQRNQILERPRLLDVQRKKIRAEEKQYLIDLTKSFEEASQEEVHSDSQQGDSASASPRSRKPRNPRMSRRKRRQKNETQEQHQERIERLNIDQTPDPDIDHDH